MASVARMRIPNNPEATAERIIDGWVKSEADALGHTGQLRAHGPWIRIS